MDFTGYVLRGRRPALGRAAVAILATSAVAFAQSGPPSEAGRLQAFREQHDKLYAEFVQAVDQIARQATAAGLKDAAGEIRRAAEPVDAAALHPGSLPTKVQPDIPASLPAAERTWRIKLRNAREEFAKELYLLSRRALHGGFPSYAYELVREVAWYDSDHRSARRLLGQMRSGDEWVTPFAASMARRRYVWHEKFGWLPRHHVERYEKGERYFSGRWISAAREAEIRRDFRNAWTVRTEHFLVKTNHSLERGVDVAKKLEDFYGYFFQVFAGFFNTPEQMQKLFEGAAGRRLSRSARRPYLVHYYATRDEYVRRLKSKIPQIAITNGLYLPADRICYFFHVDEGNNDPTLYHESTHQIFYESSSRQRLIAEDAHFWIIEGISCYMESFNREDGRMSLGDPRYQRFRAARYRYLNDGYYVPLAKFTAMGRHEFQTHPQISRNYSQAAGLSKFFMEYDGGRYRDALIEHVSQLYGAGPRSSTRPQSLAELTGVSYAELDRQYGEFLKNMTTDGERPASTPSAAPSGRRLPGEE